ncbi:unnamed protein product [Arabis nemorensis]|uniref:Uncharacterized protein n=1 Tax=Arabis nemorensis TaxID=586526 RepID=A0A565CAZ8_9BRAS|nr:unnamed protein product [Arabis nemorensis]
MDHEPATSLDVPEPSVLTNQFTQEMQMISDLRGQMEQLQREMLELRNTVTSYMLKFATRTLVTMNESTPTNSSVDWRDKSKFTG